MPTSFVIPRARDTTQRDTPDANPDDPTSTFLPVRQHDLARRNRASQRVPSSRTVLRRQYYFTREFDIPKGRSLSALPCVLASELSADTPLLSLAHAREALRSLCSAHGAPPRAIFVSISSPDRSPSKCLKKQWRTFFSNFGVRIWTSAHFRFTPRLPETPLTRHALAKSFFRCACRGGADRHRVQVRASSRRWRRLRRAFCSPAPRSLTVSAVPLLRYVPRVRSFDEIERWQQGG